jgi:hypothetical protein
MDQNPGIGRLHVVELGFNTTRMLFTFGNLAAIAVDALADLGDGSSSSGIKVLEEVARHIRKSKPIHEIKNVEKFIKKDSKITPVYLANEEFKFDPITVALAGGGNVDHGAKIFEKMVKNVRAHKNSNGLELPPKAKHPLEYMKIV